MDAPEAPVVAGLPWLGSAVSYGRDAPAFLAACRARHGDVFTVVIAGQRMTFVLDPHDHASILKLQHTLSFSELAHEISSRAFGHARLEGEVAHAMEQATAAHLRGPALLALNEVAWERLSAWLDAHSLGGGEPVALYALVRRALFVVGAETLFGSGGWDAAAQADFEAFDARFPLLVAGVPAPLLGVAGARRRLGRRLEPGRPDRSEMCLQRGVALGAGPAEQGKVDLSVLWAALGNTLPAAFWTLAHLALDPVGRARVTEEVRGTTAAFGDVSAMPRLQSAVSEALRLTSASITLRRALAPTVLHLADGRAVRVRQGDLVCLFPWLMHHDPEIYEAPEQFRHDRFLATDDGPPVFLKGGRRLRLPLMPYGGGVSTCPGRHLANTEIKQFVAAILTRFDLTAVGDAVPPVDRRRAGLGVLPPRGDLQVRLHPVTA